MGTEKKLIQWGWINEQGHSLSWHYWQEKRNRQAVAYLCEQSGKVKPIYNFLARDKQQ